MISSVILGFALRGEAYDQDRLAGGRKPDSVEKGEHSTLRVYEWAEDYGVARERIEAEVALQQGEVTLGDRQPSGWFLRNCIVSFRQGDEGKVRLVVDVYPEEGLLQSFATWVKRSLP